jgi:SSS family solute:Na+ symporter
MISNIDIGVLVLYFILVLGIGFIIGLKTKTGEDLFLGGRTFGWGLVGLSLFASNISSSTIIGLSGAAYSTGVVQSVYEWASAIPLLIAAVIFVPLYLRSKITTIPEFLELRYDVRSRNFFSAITIFISVVVEMSGGLYAGAIVIQFFFPDLVLWHTTLLIAVVAGIYTAFGGLKAVVYTDAIQAVILIVGCSVLTFILFGKLDYSWDNVLKAAPEGHFSMIRPIGDESLPWPGLILGVPFLGFWYWSTNQFIVQRVLGSKDIPNARWGIMFAGILKFIPLFIMVIPGAMAISLFPGLENADMVFPTIMTKVLPTGLLGLVLAGLVSAIMSSVDSTLNSASTLLVKDFIEPNSKGISDTRIANYGRITTLILMVVAAIWAPLIANFSSLWAYLQQMFSIVVPPIAVIFLVGVFYKRGNGTASFLTLILGTAFGVLLFVLEQFDMWDLHYTYNVGLIFGVSTAIFMIIGAFGEPTPVEKIEKYTYRKELLSAGMEGMPWYKDYRFHGLLLLILVAIVFITFN